LTFEQKQPNISNVLTEREPFGGFFYAPMENDFWEN